MQDQESGWTWFLFSPDGRVTRSEYWLKFMIPFTLIYAFCALLDYMARIKLFTSLFSLIALVPNIMVPIKRCHDRGKSGWFLLLCIIPLVNLWVWIELWFLGSEPDNQYGPERE